MSAFDLEFESWTSTCVIAVIAIFLYWFSSNNHDYWKKRGVPFDKPKPFVGSLWQIFSKPLHQFEMDNYMKYGSVYGSFEGHQPVLTIGDPALLKDILVKDFPAFCSRRVVSTGDKIVDGTMLSLRNIDEWKRIRSIITPTFSTGKIKKMLEIFKECSLTLVKNFHNLSNKGKPFDAVKLYAAFTMDVIASSAFSTKIDSHNNPENKFVVNAKAFFTRSAIKKFFRMITPGLVEILRIKVTPTEVTDFFRDATLQIIEERRRTGQTRNDFLQLLMDTAKEVNDSEKAEIPENGDVASNYGVHEDIQPQPLKNRTCKNLSLDEVVAHCVLFFTGGYATTTSTLSFATHLLALHPGIQDRVRAEVDEAIKEAQGDVTYDALLNMKHLDNVISETLRMYPPAPRSERRAEHDYKLGNTGITIPKHMMVSIPIYAIHKDPKFYPNPEEFNPDRFSPEERSKHVPYTYLPFGAGPRTCIAMRFALLEMKVCLAYLIANFIIKRCPETKVPLEFNLGQGLISPKEIIVQMEKREDCLLRI